MQRYIDELKNLKKETGQYLAAIFDTESEDSVENIRIKTEALEIIKKAYESETAEKYAKIKSLGACPRTAHKPIRICTPK